MNNKAVVKQYMDSYNALDHETILSLLTDDVEWVCPGAFHHKGKEAFDREIENPAFEGAPVITVTRIFAEGDIVVAEGKVLAKKKGEAPFHLVFCDVFEMENGKIRKLISYLMPVPEN